MYFTMCHRRRISLPAEVSSGRRRADARVASIVAAAALSSSTLSLSPLPLLLPPLRLPSAAHLRPSNGSHSP